MPYTLNAFDTITSPGSVDRVVMKSPLASEVNGGREGQVGWESGECLWYLEAAFDN